MNLQNAMEITGKAYREGWDNDRYVFIHEGQLCFANTCIFRVSDYIKYCKNDWQPYYEVVEIRPEKAGELWEWEDMLYFTNLQRDSNHGVLVFMTDEGDLIDTGDIDYRGCAHNKNGWTRLYPKVEADSVERIEIENVKWKESGSLIYPAADVSHVAWYDLVDLPRMKMILEIPKDKP